MKRINKRIVNRINILCLFITLFLSLSAIGFMQPDPSFSLSDNIGCTPLTVSFINEGSTGGGYDHEWKIDNVVVSDLENYDHEFLNSGIFEVKHVVTNNSTFESDSLTSTVEVLQTPSAGFVIDPNNRCVNGNVIFYVSSFAAKDSVYWDFGDGQVLHERGLQTFYHAYNAQGTYPLQLITYYKQCSDTSYSSVDIDGPIADFTMSEEEECTGTPVTFTIDITSDVLSYSWDTDDGNTLNGSPVDHTYDVANTYYPKLTVVGSTKNCTIEDTLLIRTIDAEFNYTPDQACDMDTVFFFNGSTDEDNILWDFDNGQSSNADEPFQVFSSGTYTVELKASNTAGCLDSVEYEIVVNDNPVLTLGNEPFICPGDAIQINASGGDEISWSPGSSLDDSTSYTPEASPDVTTTYIATITDNTTSCTQTGELTVYLRELPRMDGIVISPTDTLIYIGDTIFMATYDSLDRVLNYSWTPDDDWISCTDCPDPWIQPLQTQIYTLEIADTHACYIPIQYDVYIEVDESYVIGIPEAFTPNGDFINETIKVDGRGVKRLIEFRIYNRWGEQLFFTTDISESWDGTFEGKPQSIDSYVFLVKAEMWNGQIVTKQGTFSLIR